MATYSDAFTYSGGVLATVSSGAWTARNGSMDVTSNQFYDGAGTTNSYSEVAAATADFSDSHEAEITVHALGTADYVGPAVRVSASGCYAVRCDGVNAAGRVLGKMESTTWTALSTVRVVPVNGDTVKIRAVGTTITVYINGALVDTVTDSTHTSGQPGIYYHRDDSNVSRGDNFAASDVDVGGLGISSVSADNEVSSAEADFAVVGTGLSAGQTFTISGVACTELSFSSSTSVKLTAPNAITSNIKFGKREFKVSD